MTMSRSISWRRLCPESVSTKIDEALAATFYILHQTGPTAFILKEEGSSRKIKVLLGDPNMCSCSDFKKNHDLCTHILWVLLKKFRVPRTNPLIWQLALVEREIDEIILGFLRRQQPIQSDCSKSHDHTHTVPQREIGPEDVCPICQEDLLGSSHSLIYCRFSCGQSIHTKCMKIMANHQKAVSGERPTQCPLCREDFGPIQPAKSKAARRLLAEKASLHLGVACSHCHVCPIAGKCYKCSTCVSYHLCHACFSSNQVHMLHPFQCRKHSKQPWRPVVRSSTPSIPPSDSPALPPALITSLQSRSLTENDYEVLLQLDIPSNSTPGSPRNSQTSGRHLIGVPERVINSLHVEPLDGTHPLIVGQATCQICGGEYLRGDWIKKLPCKHKFHRECIHEWLHTNSCCPVDGQSVYDQSRERRRVTRDRRQDSSRQRGVIPLTRALTVQHSTGSSATRVQGQSSRFNRQSSGIRGLQSNSTDESAEFTVSGQSIGGDRAICTPTSGKNNRSRRLTANSSSLHSTLSSATQRLSNAAHRTISRSHYTTSSTDTTLPDLSNVAITALSRQRRNETSRKLFRSKRQLTVSIPSTEPNSVPPRENHTSPTPQVSTGDGLGPDVSLVPVSNGYVQCEGQVLSTQQTLYRDMSNDKCDQELRNYISVSKSPLHRSNGVLTCVSHAGSRGDEDRSISLPSLPVANQSIVGKPTLVSGGRVFKGSLVRARKSTDPFSKDSSELDTSLQVSSFKLCPLPLTNSMMAASASLRLNV